VRLFEGTQWDRPPRCERCNELESDCKCPPPEPERVAPGKQTAKLAVEKRAKGKVVTVVRGLAGKGNDLKKLLSALQSVCGTGGSLDGDEVILQGRQLEKVREALERLGFKVKG
jgi:translation initiation factor 1